MENRFFSKNINDKLENMWYNIYTERKTSANKPQQQADRGQQPPPEKEYKMSTATNTTDVYALYDILSHGRYAMLTREPQERFKNGLCHIKLTITIPDGYRIGTSYDGNALLVSLDGDNSKNHYIGYNFYDGRVESVFQGIGAPIKGCHIISREEI